MSYHASSKWHLVSYKDCTLSGCLTFLIAVIKCIRSYLMKEEFILAYSLENTIHYVGECMEAEVGGWVTILYLQSRVDHWHVVELSYKIFKANSTITHFLQWGCEGHFPFKPHQSECISKHKHMNTCSGFLGKFSENRKQLILRIIVKISVAKINESKKDGYCECRLIFFLILLPHVLVYLSICKWWILPFHFQ